ncbi:MAG: YopX family protein [Ruminococcus sp.]|nr:YopX family protein [Ruminococcus sp.]
MREIKFRGKRTDNKEWVYGSLDLCGDTPFMTWREVDSDGDTVPWFVEVQEDTIGQFTGLKDNKGKEIYEGDIVRYSEANDEIATKQVHFIDGAFSPLTEIIWMGDAECEVIGNIFDNPNLLTK